MRVRQGLGDLLVNRFLLSLNGRQFGISAVTPPGIQNSRLTGLSPLKMDSELGWG